MSPLDKAVAHFAAAEAQSIPVPEWDLVVYWRPVTIKQAAEVATKWSGAAQRVPATVMIRALDEEGRQLFAPGEGETTASVMKRLQSEVDGDVLSRIFDAMTRPVEDAAGND